MRLPNAVMALSVLASLSSCSSKQILEKIAPKAEVEFAKQYLGELRAGRLDEVERQLDVQVRTPDIRIKLAEVASYFPPASPSPLSSSVRMYSRVPTGGLRTSRSSTGSRMPGWWRTSFSNARTVASSSWASTSTGSRTPWSASTPSR